MALSSTAALSKDRRNATGPSMEHRHFAVVAGIIAELRDEDREAMAMFFAERLAGTNPKFSRSRFLSACKEA